MIRAIRDIGEWIQNYQQKETLDVLIEPINPNNYKYAIILSINDDEWELEIEEYDQQSSSRYLYRKGSPNGVNYSPTSMITEIEKTFQNKFFAWFQKVLSSKEMDKKDKDWHPVLKVSEILAREQQNILSLIAQKLSGIKEASFLTLKFDGKYLKEIPIFVQLFLEMVNEKDLAISSNEQVCSVCGEFNSIVMAGSSAFAFYTIDKPGFISGNFNEPGSWRNHPVCIECNLLLQEGKRYIEENLRFNFYGLSYLLIPQFIYGNLNLKDNVMRVLEDDKKRKSMDSETVHTTIASEKDILYYLKDESDYLMVHLLFLQKMNAAERILLLIQDVFPSHLRRIFGAKQYVEEQYIKHDGSVEVYHFGRIRTFFQKSDEGKKSSDLDKYFLEITAAVFRGQTLDIQFLTTFYMKVIRTKFNNFSSDNQDWEFQFAVRDALMNTLFFSRLGILSIKEGAIMSSTRFKAVFEKYVPHLDTNEKRGLFLLGVLAQVLLDIQKKIRNAQPFREKLKGLRLREREFKGLVPSIKEKLWQYESDPRYESYERYYASLLLEEISTLFEQSSPNWKISTDEMNFHFAAGMSLKYKALSLLKEDKGNHESQENLIEGEEKYDESF